MGVLKARVCWWFCFGAERLARLLDSGGSPSLGVTAKALLWESMLALA